MNDSNFALAQTVQMKPPINGRDSESNSSGQMENTLNIYIGAYGYNVSLPEIFLANTMFNQKREQKSIHYDSRAIQPSDVDAPAKFKSMFDNSAKNTDLNLNLRGAIRPEDMPALNDGKINLSHSIIIQETMMREAMQRKQVVLKREHYRNNARKKAKNIELGLLDENQQPKRKDNFWFIPERSIYYQQSDGKDKSDVSMLQSKGLCGLNRENYSFIPEHPNHMKALNNESNASNEEGIETSKYHGSSLDSSSSLLVDTDYPIGLPPQEHSQNNRIMDDSKILHEDNQENTNISDHFICSLEEEQKKNDVHFDSIFHSSTNSNTSDSSWNDKHSSKTDITGYPEKEVSDASSEGTDEMQQLSLLDCDSINEQKNIFSTKNESLIPLPLCNKDELKIMADEDFPSYKGEEKLDHEMPMGEKETKRRNRRRKKRKNETEKTVHPKNTTKESKNYIDEPNFLIHKPRKTSKNDADASIESDEISLDQNYDNHDDDRFMMDIDYDDSHSIAHDDSCHSRHGYGFSSDNSEMNLDDEYDYGYEEEDVEETSDNINPYQNLNIDTDDNMNDEDAYSSQNPSSSFGLNPEEDSIELSQKEVQDALASSGLNILFKEVNNFNVMTPEEEFHSFETYYKTDNREEKEKIRQFILCRNIKLVISIAKKIQKNTNKIPLEDMIDEGMIGLMKAIEKFDLAHGCKFSTYAYNWVKQAITRYIANNGDIIRIPVHFSDNLAKIRRFENTYMMEHGTDNVPYEEIEKHLSIPIKKIKNFKKASMPVSSLDSPIDENENSIMDVIEDKMAMSPESITINNALHASLMEAIKTLDEREAFIVTNLYNITEHTNPLNLQEIAQKFGLTKERIRQIASEALKKLRHPMKCAKYKEWVAL